MPSIKKAAWLEICCALLILLFTYASLSKFGEWTMYKGQMRNQVFPVAVSEILIYLVPITEIIIVILLLFKRTSELGLWASFILMVLFTVYTALVLMKVFPRIPCSCGGVIKYLSWTQHLIFNIVFSGIALAGIAQRRKQNRRQSVNYASI